MTSRAADLANAALGLLTDKRIADFEAQEPVGLLPKDPALVFLFNWRDWDEIVNFDAGDEYASGSPFPPIRSLPGDQELKAARHPMTLWGQPVETSCYIPEGTVSCREPRV